MSPYSPVQKPPRRTLRQALKDLLWRHNTAIPLDQTIGSDILKRANSKAPQLPNFSTVSVFPDFADHANIRHQTPLASHTPPQSQRSVPHLQISARNPSVRRAPRLLPQPSLSSFTTSLHGCNRVVASHVVYELVPERYQRGVSRQASVVFMTPVSKSDGGLSSRSSLRIQQPAARRPIPSVPTKSPLRSYKISNYTEQQVLRPHANQSETDHSRTPKSSGCHRYQPECDTKPSQRSLLHNLDHFKCFCVIDVGEAGCPVTGTSSDLRYIFELGERFVLNNHECEGKSMDIVSGLDAAGEEIVHLVLFTPLINPSSGIARYMLVSLVEVTDFIKDSATSLPELDTISEEASIVDDIATPPLAPRYPTFWTDGNRHLSADDLLGGCSLPDASLKLLHSKPELDDDIWLSLAETEGGLKSNRRKTYATSNSSATRSSASSHVNDTDNVLDEFMSSLQELYSDFFVLGKSPLADAYEMCSVSPSVFETQEWIAGHLSHTSPEVLTYLAVRLGECTPFSLGVRWGDDGHKKHMYCSPLYTGSSVTWVCYLVDAVMEQLW